MHTKKGFSLLELLIVLAIFTIIASITLTSYCRHLSKYQLRGAARLLMGDIMLAKTRAVSQNNRYRIMFIDDHQYNILDDDDDDNSADDDELTIHRDIQKFYKNITFGTTEAAKPSKNPIFSPLGTMHWPLGYTINLRNNYGITSVVISSAGRVRIE